MKTRLSPIDCPASVSGHDSGRDGHCVWCRRKVDPAVPGPKRIYGHTELDDAWRRAYDPDWGGGPYDQDP